ncbi:MAG TPA: hypothetical protein DCL21_02330, partial [Alphaproteobacteria bacterium]|nr:hypothetical protein [Alphaproteobacteria bacterium]
MLKLLNPFSFCISAFREAKASFYFNLVLKSGLFTDLERLVSLDNDSKYAEVIMQHYRVLLAFKLAGGSILPSSELIDFEEKYKNTSEFKAIQASLPEFIMVSDMWGSNVSLENRSLQKKIRKTAVILSRYGLKLASKEG